MYRLTCVTTNEREVLQSELRHFFRRVRQLKARMRTPVYGLNRLQRRRCLVNLTELEARERELYALSYSDDIYDIYRHMQRFVKLDDAMLARLLAERELRIGSLFI